MISLIFNRSATIKYRNFLRKIPAPWGLFLIWTTCVIGLIFPEKAFMAAWPLALSSCMLSKYSRYFWHFSVAGFFFWFFFSLVNTLAYHQGFGEYRSPAQLALFISLGLHLMTIWTPLELGRTFEKLFRHLIGRHLSLLISLALVIMARMLPLLVDQALILKKTIQTRLPKTSWTQKTLLWGRALIRLTFAQSHDLTRALLKR